MATHPIVHVEIPASNTKEAGEFYSKLFDWKLELDTNFNYLQFQPQGGPGGAFVDVDETTKPGNVLVYIGADDIDTVLSQVEQLGGKIITPKMEIPMTGWFAVFSDPTGNRIGLYTSAHSQG